MKSTFLSIVVIACLAALGAGLSPMAQWAPFIVHYGKGVCFMAYKTALIGRAYTLFLFVFYIGVPIGIVSFAYYKIFKTIKEHNMGMNTSRQAAIHSINVEEVRITKALFAAVLGFNLCWAPIGVIDFVDAYTQYKLAFPRQVFLMYMYLGYGSCSINPIIYGVMNRAFRAEFLRVLTFWRRKNEVVPPHSCSLQTQRPAVGVCEQV